MIGFAVEPTEPVAFRLIAREVIVGLDAPYRIVRPHYGHVADANPTEQTHRHERLDIQRVGAGDGDDGRILMHIFARAKGPLGDSAVNRTADDPLLKCGARPRELQFRHALAQLGEQDLLLRDTEVGLRVLRILHAAGVAGEKIALALHDPGLLVQNRLFCFDLGCAFGALLIGGDNCLLNRGLNLRDHLPARHPITALHQNPRQDAGDRAPQLHRQRRLQHAIKGGGGRCRGEERPGGRQHKKSANFRARKTSFKRKKSHEDRPLIQPRKTTSE